ncbi:5-(carboxyamino)imidazole ribonucleotide mutase [bacterium]|nr:5-(carboxyamino)imidazole ribonucleotide mutase [bacterium]
MGSDSDWPIMSQCVNELKKYGIPVDVRVLSAHRTPEDAAAFVSGAQANGFGVIIAAAGGAAHLAGVAAAHTSLPVIGVPMAATPLAGFDALLSTVQMPPGVPVGTVGVGEFGAVNAAVLAARILALSDDALARMVTDARTNMAEKVRQKDRALQEKIAKS